MSGIFGSSQWMYNSGADFYNGVATQSLRFDSGSGNYLTKTYGSGNQALWTVSMWIKRASLTTDYFFGSQATGDDIGSFSFNSSNQLVVNNKVGSSTGVVLNTDMVFRDTLAWYHLVVVYKGDEASASNRAKIYVNGSQVSTTVTESLSTGNGYFNSANIHGVGRVGSYTVLFFNGYMAEVYLVDGTALDPTSFGEFKNGVWIAKEYNGSYGTNGFRLQFNQTGTGSASSSTIGADTSGNDNHFSSSGIVASDCDMPDSPENNFSTFNVLSGHSSTTISEGNLRALATNSSNYFESQNSTFGITSGKWYAEFRADDLLNDGADNGTQIGVTTVPYNRGSGNQNGFITGNTRINLDNNGGAYLGIDTSITQQGNIGTYADGDIIGVALNVDDSEVSFYKNGSAITNAQDISITNVNGVYFFEVQIRKFSSDTSQITANFGQDSTFAGATTAGGNADGNGIGDFKYSVPSGYLALCTSNLPEPTISPNADTQADDYFNTVLYTGNGSTQSITGVGFQPDFLWIKERNGTGYHALFDAVRGVTKALYSNDTLAEGTGTALTSFDSNGFTLSLDISQARTNDNSDTYVSWNWKAGGTAVSNTDGTITSSVSANTDAGFSIVTYTGNSTAGATIGHGLGAVVRMVIIKNRDQTDNWAVGHTDIGFSNHLQLNVTDASTSANAVFNSTAPTSTVFSVGTNHKTNASSEDYIAYCFAEIEGYSKFGSYTGNSSTDGTFVYTGFRPAWVMVKYYTGSGANHWWIWDSVRNTFNVVDEALVANLSVSTQSPLDVDFVSNGFKFRTSNSEMNGSSASYIYMAFAENPFKYANAR